MKRYDIVKDDISDVKPLWDVIKYVGGRWELKRSFDTLKAARAYVKHRAYMRQYMAKHK